MYHIGPGGVREYQKMFAFASVSFPHLNEFALFDLYKELHANPELSYQETETSARLAAIPVQKAEYAQRSLETLVLK